MTHAFKNSHNRPADPVCSICGGLNRDSIHGSTDAERCPPDLKARKFVTLEGEWSARTAGDPRADARAELLAQERDNQEAQGEPANE